LLEVLHFEHSCLSFPSMYQSLGCWRQSLNFAIISFSSLSFFSIFRIVGQSRKSYFELDCWGDRTTWQGILVDPSPKWTNVTFFIFRTDRIHPEIVTSSSIGFVLSVLCNKLAIVVGSWRWDLEENVELKRADCVHFVGITRSLQLQLRMDIASAQRPRWSKAKSRLASLCVVGVLSYTASVQLEVELWLNLRMYLVECLSVGWRLWIFHFTLWHLMCILEHMEFSAANVTCRGCWQTSKQIGISVDEAKLNQGKAFPPVSDRRSHACSSGAELALSSSIHPSIHHASSSTV